MEGAAGMSTKWTIVPGKALGGAKGPANLNPEPDKPQPSLELRDGLEIDSKVPTVELEGLGTDAGPMAGDVPYIH